MKVNNAFEQEVNQIRLALYEKTKDMSPSEITDYYRRSTEATIKEYGFRVITHAKADTS